MNFTLYAPTCFWVIFEIFLDNNLENFGNKLQNLGNTFNWFFGIHSVIKILYSMLKIFLKKLPKKQKLLRHRVQPVSQLSGHEYTSLMSHVSANMTPQVMRLGTVYVWLLYCFSMKDSPGKETCLRDALLRALPLGETVVRCVEEELGEIYRRK